MPPSSGTLRRLVMARGGSASSRGALNVRWISAGRHVGGARQAVEQVLGFFELCILPGLDAAAGPARRHGFACQSIRLRPIDLLPGQSIRAGPMRFVCRSRALVCLSRYGSAPARAQFGLSRSGTRTWSSHTGTLWFAVLEEAGCI